MNSSDGVLLDGLRKGDKEAFSILFLRYYQSIYRFLFKLTGSREEAEDLAQEVFVKLYRNPLSERRQHNLRAWLYRVALNQAYNSQRSRRREEQRWDRATRLAESGGQPANDPADSVLQEEQRDQVRRVLRSLPPRQQQCLVLRYEGFSYAEIAEALEAVPGSVGTLLARAEAEFARRYTQLQKEGAET